VDQGNIVIFESLAGLCTCGFLMLVFFALRFMRKWLELGEGLLAVADGLRRDLEAMLEDLRDGAARFRKGPRTSQAPHVPDPLAMARVSQSMVHGRRSRRVDVAAKEAQQTV